MFAAQAYDAARLSLKRLNQRTTSEQIREGLAKPKTSPGLPATRVLTKKGIRSKMC